MKYFNLKFLTFFLTALLAFGVGWAETVTFTAGTDTSDGSSITKDGITFTITSGSLSTAEYRIYANESGTVSIESGTITNIVFNCTANGTTKYGPGCWNTTTGSYSYSGKVGTWTGSANSITFTSTGSQVRVTSFTVTYESSGTPKTPVDLYFSSTSATATLGQSFTPPTLTVDPVEAASEVAYSSSDENVATVNASTGAITLVAAGTTTITAAINNSDTYVNKSTSYTLTVEEAPEPGVLFKETFNKCNGTGGNSGGWSGTIATTDWSDQLADNEGWSMTKVNAADKCIRVGTTNDQGFATTPLINVTPSAVYTLTFKAGAWNATNDVTTLKLTATGGTLSEESVELTKGSFNSYSITFTASQNSATITFQGNQVKNNRFFLDEVVLMEPPVAAPEFSLAEGTYTSEQSVTITAEDGATIYYTLDGTDPTTESAEYTGAITISQTTTLKAIAVKDGRESEISTALYTITTNPFINVSKTSLSINDVVDENNKFDVSARNIRDNQNVSVTADNGFNVTGEPAEGSGNSWADWGGFNSNSNHSVDGTVTVTYGGTELIKEGNIACGTLDAEVKNVAVNYRSDVYIITNHGTNTWDYDGILMTYDPNDKVYTGSVTVPANACIMFSRKTGETYDWNQNNNGGNRLFFGAKMDNGQDWPYGENTTGILGMNPSYTGKYCPIYFEQAGTYTITISDIEEENKKFSITSSNVANIAQAQDFEGEKFMFTGNTVVTYQNGEYLWIRDIANRDGEINSGLIYGTVEPTFENGEIVAPGWTAGNELYLGHVPRFTNPTGVTKGEGIAAAAALPLTNNMITTDDVNKYASLSEVTIKTASDKNYYFTVGETDYQLRDEFGLFTTDDNKLQEGKTYNVKGVVSFYSRPQLWLTEVEEVQKVATPTFDPAAGTYYEPKEVTISCETEEATIHYTTDGTDPTATSDVYSAPITVDQNMTIKAIAMKVGWLNSDIAEAAYTIKDPGDLTKYTKVTSTDQLTDGNYLIVYEMGAYGLAFDGSLETLDATENTFDVDISGNDIYTTDEEGYFTINVTAGTIKSASGKYIGQTSDANGLKAQEDVLTNTITIEENVAKIVSSGGAYLRYNDTSGQERFRYFKSSSYTNQQPIQLYKSAVAPVPELGVSLPAVPEENYTVGQEIPVKATVENGSETTELAYTAKVGEETITLEADGEGNVTLPNKKAGNVEVTVTATDGDRTATDTKIYVFDKAPALKITLDPATGEYYVGANQAVTVTVETPIGTPTITYKYGEEGEVQTYDAETGIVLPTTEPATLNLIVTVDDEGYEHDGTNTATAEYTIKAKEPAIVVTATFDPEGKDYVTGEDVTVTATIENAIEPTTVTYSIENSSHQMIVNNQPFENGTKLYTDEPGNYYLTIKVQDNYPHEGNAAYGSTGSIQYFVRAAATTIEEAQATAQLFKYNGEAVVAYQKNDLMWIRDNQGNSGLIRYTTNNNPGPFVNGDNLASGWTATYRTENSLPIFADGNNLSVESHGETVVPYKLTTITADDVNKYASLSEIQITHVDGNSYYFTVGEQEYRLEKAYCDVDLAADKYYNVVGVVTINENNPSYKVWMQLISAEEVNPVAIAGPTFCPAGGTYTEPKEVAIACATPGMKIMYKIGEGEGETWNEYTDPFTVSDNCTVYAKGTMGDRTVYTDSEVTSATYTINTLPAANITDGYYNLVNNSPEVEGLKANVAGRRTMNFVSDAADKAGTVFRIAAENGVVKTLRSQGVDLKQYADRAMNYVDPIINTVIDKLTTMEGVDDPTGAGTILGQEGLGKLIKLFKDNLDNNLYVEGNAGAYRIYARTPSMQPVVDFYKDPENTDKIEAKLPDLEGYINQVLNKVRAKVNSAGMNGEDVIPKFNLVDVWQNMGGTLIKPEGENVLPFYRQVLTNKEYVWNFALQTAKIYLEAIKSTITDMNMVPAEYGDVIGKLESVRPETKYFIIQRSRAAGTGELDYISENNVEIINNDSRTFWSLPELTDFTVNFPEENKYGSKLVTTLYTDFAYDVPKGVTAYKVTDIDDNADAVLAAIEGTVPAQTPVLLMTDAAAKATTKNVTLNTTDGTRPDGNLLEGPDYAVNKYQLKSQTVVDLFSLAEGIVGSELLADYAYLQLRNSGTVNNRYFWGVTNDLGDLSEPSVVRSLEVKDGKLAFSDKYKAETNQAFLVTEDANMNVINLPVVATPTFDPEAGTYNEAQTVTIACETEGATIYYKIIGDEDWTEFDPEQPIRVEATTTIQAYAAKDGLGDSEIAEATYKIELPAEAPTFDPVPGSYTEAQQVTIIAPEGATVSYRIDGGEWQTYTPGEEIHVDATQTIEAMVEMEGMSESAVATGYYVIDIPEALPTDMPVFDGYYSILNSGKYANVQGRKTLTFTDAPNVQAGTVIRLKSDNTGKVEVLRSQAADLQRYAYRALDYVPDIVQIVVDKLGAEGEGHILGQEGLDAIMDKFDKSFKPDLYIEKAGENGYRIYGKTPSMQPVVDFYRENKDKVEAKLPNLVEFINSALAKLRAKANQAGMDGDNVFVDFDLKTIWTRMGGNLTDPEVDEMGFYRDVLNYKDNVWNFAYQTATFYLEKIKNTGTYASLLDKLGEYAQYLDKIDQIHPDFKYYIVANEDVTKPDFISEGNTDIANDADRTIWTIEPRENFTVNFPETDKLGDEYVTTLYTDFAYTLPEGVTAYKVTEVNKQGIATIEALDGIIPAQTPVLLKSTATTATVTLSTEDGTAVSGNLLVGPDVLIEKYQFKTEQVADLFDILSQKLPATFYEEYIAQYEYLMLKYAGLVNNKYFWNVNSDLGKLTGDDCGVRSLETEDGVLAFRNNWTTETNKAFLMNDEENNPQDVIYLTLRGDVNRNGKIEIGDVVALIDILLAFDERPYLEPTEKYPQTLDYEAADFNENGEITIKDVTDLIDYLLDNM